MTDIHLYNFTQSTEVWYNDGNVVLVAENEGFRVYSGILAQQSAMFADLFSIPQPPDAETYSGCPVIRLQDPAKDVCLFFKVLYDAR